MNHWRAILTGIAGMLLAAQATTVAADLLEWEGQTGVIAPGYFADIIAVDDNPLDGVSIHEEVIFVMKNGVVYKHD